MAKLGIKTNLTPGELEKVGFGILELAKSQHMHEYKPENTAEARLLSQVESSLDEFLVSLQEDFMKVLLED